MWPGGMKNAENLKEAGLYFRTYQVYKNEGIRNAYRSLFGGKFLECGHGKSVNDIGRDNK